MNQGGLILVALYMMVNFMGCLSLGSGLSILFSKKMRRLTNSSICAGLALILAGMLMVFGTHLILKMGR